MGMFSPSILYTNSKLFIFIKRGNYTSRNTLTSFYGMGSVYSTINTRSFVSLWYAV